MSARSLRTVAALGATVVVIAAGTAFAASLGVTSQKLTAWDSATSVTCTGSTVTVAAVADSTVDQAAPTTNYGSDTLLKVRAETLLPLLTLLDTNARTLVRFTLPTVPDLCSVTEAKLRLYASTSASGRTLDAFRAGAAWTEGTVTWNTQPATAGTAATTSSASGWREWTVTSHVTTMYSGSNNGFVVRDSAESPVLQSYEQRFNSRTNATDQPELVITFG